MLSSLVILALALVGAVQATPAPSSLTPVVESVSVADASPALPLTLGSVSTNPNSTLGSVSTNPNSTLGEAHEGVHADAAAATYPATIFLCRTSGCGSCTGYDLSAQRHKTCLNPGFNFASMYINQPSNSGLPYGVYTGPSGCGSFAQIPKVNTCYKPSNYVGRVFELSP